MDVRSVVLLGTMVCGCAHAYGTAPPLEPKRIAVNDVEFSYIETGAGARDPIVFVHGELQDYRVWNKHLASFAPGYRVIAYSRRNHFPNTVSVEGLGDAAADAHGEDLAAFITALALKRVHIVAHSSGAHAALFFAAKYPDMVNTLVLNEPPAVGVLRNSPLGLTLYRELETKRTASRDAFRTGDLTTGMRLFNDSIGGPGNYEKQSKEMQGIMRDNAAAQAADALTKNPLMLFSCDMAGQVAAPTLLTSGTRTLPLFQRIVEELKKCLPDGQHVAIAAAHDLPMENPRAFTKAMETFMSVRSRDSVDAVAADR